MPLFKDQVALEACPAKTAESVSYGATFAVLAWLVLSNYSSMGHAGASSATVADAEPDTTPSRAAFTEEQTSAAWAATPSPTPNLETSPYISPPHLTQGVAVEGEAPYTPLADLEAWHDSLAPHRQPLNLKRPSEFPASAWRATLPSDVQLVDTYPVDLVQLSPMLDTDLYYLHLHDSVPDLDTDESATPIHEITVTGAEPERLVARPDSISRPQLPRPYRAQEIQRGLILPPRIQALRP